MKTVNNHMISQVMSDLGSRKKTMTPAALEARRNAARKYGDPKRKCMVPHCKRSADYARGLCSSCYQQVQRLVKRKETTWDQLEAKGKVLPAINLRAQRYSKIRDWALS